MNKLKALVLVCAASLALPFLGGCFYHDRDYRGRGYYRDRGYYHRRDYRRRDDDRRDDDDR